MNTHLDRLGSHLDSHLAAVAVHRRGALVTRVVELPEGAEPTSGASEVTVGPLPLAIDDGSVRVAVLGEGDLPTATGATVTLEVPTLDEDAAPARPEDLETAEHRVERLEDQLAQVAKDARRVEALGVVTRPAPEPGHEPAPSPTDARIALLELRDKRLAALDDERDHLDRALREARRTLAELTERERRASTARRAEPHELRKAVRVSLRGGQGAKARLEVTYRVDAARWAPSYVLRLSPDLSRGTLEIRAVVAQQTGEDWDGVRLSLSTAELAAWSEPPELASVRIGRRVPAEPKRGWRAPPTGTDELFSDFDRARERSKGAPPPAPLVEPMEQPAMEAMDVSLMAGGAADMLQAVAKSEAFAAAKTKRHRAEPAPMPPPTMPAPSAPSGFGAPPGAMPQGMAPARAKSMSRAGGVLGAASGAMSSLMADLADDAPGAGYGGGGFEGGAFDAEPAPFDAARAMLDYGQLRMPSASDGQRGKLVRRSRRELYLALVEEEHLEVDLDRAFDLVQRSARVVASAALPPGCQTTPASGFDYVYTSDGRLSAPSDGVFHGLSITSREADARARFVVVPRESRDAFRFVELDNPLDAPLLEGPIDVYVGEDFLSTSTLRETPPGGVVRLGLGVEQRLKVARNARYSEASGGMLGGRLDLMHEIEIELDNQLPREAEVEVRERVPVLREGEDDITLREVRSDPAWEAWEPDDDDTLEGGHRWRLRLPAGEKRTLRASYEIRIASKNELVGGNRRER